MRPLSVSFCFDSFSQLNCCHGSRDFILFGIWTYFFYSFEENIFSIKMFVNAIEAAGRPDGPSSLDFALDTVNSNRDMWHAEPKNNAIKMFAVLRSDRKSEK